MRIVFKPILIYIFSSLFILQMVSASTILDRSMTELSQNAELVFEGEVLSVQTRPSPINGMPFTYFVFKISDVIKGTYLNATIELGYAGGSLNGESLKVADLYMPALGERGVYFVESLSRAMVHPLYGWHQGHYIVEMDSAGVSRVRPQQAVELDGVATKSSVRAESPTLDHFKASVRALAQ